MKKNPKSTQLSVSSENRSAQLQWGHKEQWEKNDVIMMLLTEREKESVSAYGSYDWTFFSRSIICLGRSAHVSYRF